MQEHRIPEQTLKAFIQSKEGKKLLELLNQNGGTCLKQAVAAAQAGNYQDALHMLQPMIRTKEAEKLMDDFKKKHG